MKILLGFVSALLFLLAATSFLVPLALHAVVRGYI